MVTTSLVSVAEYLSTSFSPDREYLDGVVVERNVGELSHSTVQGEIHHWLRSRRKELGIWVYPEQRVQVTPTRYRVPDLCVVAGPRPQEQILTTPPFLCIEILSKDDRAGETQEKIDDYLASGVPYVWVVDPERRRGYLHTGGGSHEAKDGILRTENPDLAVPLAEIFAELQA
jgi:Uma2 family endonuclease